MGATVESKAILRFSGLSAQKMRQVADLVRGKDVDVALHTLRFITKAAARPMEKLITSAVANAREKANAADQRYAQACLAYAQSFGAVQQVMVVGQRQPRS